MNYLKNYKHWYVHQVKEEVGRKCSMDERDEKFVHCTEYINEDELRSKRNI
jgi:hypothetical protein